MESMKEMVGSIVAPFGYMGEIISVETGDFTLTRPFGAADNADSTIFRPGFVYLSVVPRSTIPCIFTGSLRITRSSIIPQG